MFHAIATEQLKLNMDGMMVLLVWAIGNIIVGLLLANHHKKSAVQRSFYMGNAVWNIVNALIAIVTMVMLSNTVPGYMQLKEIIYRFFTFEKLLLFNLGLDIAYVAIGSFLVERGKHIRKPSFEGYGRALWVQGGFLFLLDTVLYIVNNYYNQKYAIFILF